MQCILTALQSGPRGSPGAAHFSSSLWTASVKGRTKCRVILNSSTANCPTPQVCQILLLKPVAEVFKMWPASL